jgi:hypothetical protein
MKPEELSSAEKLMLLALYASENRLDREKLKWAAFILLRAKEEGLITNF